MKRHIGHGHNRPAGELAFFLALILAAGNLSGCVKPGGTGTQDHSVDTKNPSEVGSSDSSGEEEGRVYTVSFRFSDQSLEAPDPQSVKEGDRASYPKLPAYEDQVFLGWFPEGISSYPYDFKTPVTEDVALCGVFYKNDEDETDSDSDGLPDALEKILGTGADLADTDGDGLLDGLEYSALHLDPLKADTDANGIEDGAEDTDGDTITNLEEVKQKTAPEYADSDFDDLSDQEEIVNYKTDPLLADTDSDGVTDGVETVIGTDPLKKESLFETKWEKGEVSADHPVSAEVTAVTDPDGAGSLSVREITSTIYPALTPSSVGYVAPCYEIKTEGELKKGVLTFYYDESLEEAAEQFDPVLYRYNEEESELVEVPGQIRENGRITATVSHFSVYGIFNRSLIDEFSIPLSVLPDGMLEDKNADGLPDEIAKMLNDGKVLYDNTNLLYMITDICGDSDDWDSDGLKNGEEIEAAVTLGGKYKVLIHSNPLLPDSDGDGLTDDVERNLYGTSPMRYNRTPFDAVQDLESDGKYAYIKGTESFQNDFALTFDWDKEEKAKQLLINYLYDYAPEDTLKAHAEEIKRRQEAEDNLKYLSLVSELTKMAESTVDLYENEKNISKRKVLPYPALYLEGKDLKAEMMEAVAKEETDAIYSAFAKMDLPVKMEKNLQEIRSDDNFEKISGMVGMIKAASSSLEAATKLQMSLEMDVTDYFTVFGKTAGKSSSKYLGTTLSVASDVLDGVEKIEKTKLAYGKIKANFEAYQRYYEMLDYISSNAEDDFVRSAARKLREIVRGSEEEYLNQLGDACAKEGFYTAVDVVMDLASEEPHIAMLNTILGLMEYSGVDELEMSSINCRTMKAVSAACRRGVHLLVSEESNSFSYDRGKVTEVDDYLVQLAQSRIMGEYYLHEYVAENTSLASKLNQLFGGEKAAPEKYREIGKKKIKEIYDDANRLHLKLSHKLPYYNEFFREDLAEEPVIPKDDKILSAAAGDYNGFRSAGYWYDGFTLEEDGSFSGLAGAWSAAPGTMKDGTQYFSSIYEGPYRGHFVIREKENDHCWSLEVADHTNESEGTEYVDEDGRRVVNSYKGWLEDCEEVYLYAPNTPVSELKQYDPYIRDEFGKREYLGGYAIGVWQSADYGVIFTGPEGKKYSSYSSAYGDILLRKQYQELGQDFGTEEPVNSLIRDLDQDGIPELILTNGYKIRQRKHTYIYTFSRSRIRFLGTGPSIACAYLEDPTAGLSAFSGEADPKYSDRNYYGLFSLDELYVTYYYKEGDSILQEKVCGGEGVSYTDIRLTEDNRLMELFSEAYSGGKLKYFPER